MRHLPIILAAIIWAMLPGLAFTNQHLASIARKKAGGGGGGFTPDLLYEDCEGSGTPSSPAWTDGGTLEWDYSTSPAPLEGSESLRLTSGDSSYVSITGQTTVEGYALIRLSSLPASTLTMLGFRDSGAGAGGAVCLVRINSSGQLSVFANGSDSTFTVDSVDTTVNWHVWVRFVSSGACTVAFSSDGTRPSSGDAFTSKTGASATAAKFYVSSFTNSAGFIDKMMADTGAIPDNP